MKTGMPGMVKGMISMNFLAVEEILISIDGLIKRLYSKNERIRHTISRLERCTGTRENPHDHNVEISAYTRVLRKNEKDIKNLSTIYGQIDNFKNCTQQTDQRLAKLIYDTFPEYVTPKAGGMTRSISGGGEELSISEQAARNANLLVIAGRPQINSASDYQAYQAEKEKLVEVQQQFPDTSGNYGVNAAGINVVQTKADSAEWYRDIVINLPFTVSACGVENEAGTGEFYFDYAIQEYMQSACENVINAAKNDDKVSDLAVEKLEKLLTAELIIAIGCTESGWLEEYTGGAPTGVGVSETWTGIIGNKEGKQPYVTNCNGAKGASTEISDYYGIKESISATAALVGNNIIEMVDGGWTTKQISGDYSSDADLLYKALYNYGYGSYVIYGFNEEHALSASYKLYMYDSIVQQRGGDKNLGLQTYDEGTTNIDSLISFTYGLAGNSTDFTVLENEGLEVRRDVDITGSAASIIASAN